MLLLPEILDTKTILGALCTSCKMHNEVRDSILMAINEELINVYKYRRYAVHDYKTRYNFLLL